MKVINYMIFPLKTGFFRFFLTNENSDYFDSIFPFL